MAVSAPQFLFGCRVPLAPAGPERVRQEVLADLGVRALLGRSSRFFTELYAEGLVKNDFDADLSVIKNSAAFLAGGESADPDAVLARYAGAWRSVAENGLDEALFTRVRHAAYGDAVRALGVFSTLCFDLARCHIAGYTPFDRFALLESVTAGETAAFLRERLDPERMALSIVSP